jgi:hypothetical protein
MIRILGYTVHRADLDTLRGVVVSDTFGTQIGFYFVDLITLGDGTIWAFRLTDITIDALVGDY